VADKTGTGDFGTRNDVGVLWPTDAPPLVVAVYLTFPTEEERRGLDVLVADATRIVVEAFRG
jgi:beta-lactamase class A